MGIITAGFYWPDAVPVTSQQCQIGRGIITTLVS